MTRIYKYEFEPDDHVDIQLPQGARILHVAEQNPGRLTIWAEGAEGGDSETVPVRLLVRGTGHAAPTLLFDHFGTVLMRSGLVWHVYGPRGCKR